MDFQTWHEQTTELQNRYGYTGKPKPTKGALAETSVYEFVNDWLPHQLAWLIFSYAAEPHASKKAIAEHYDGVGQRTFHTYPKRKWVMRTGSYSIGSFNTLHTGSRFNSIITPLNRLVAVRPFNSNRLVEFLHDTRNRRAGGVFVTSKNGKKVRKCAVLQALQDNKVKGRTELYKRYTKLERLTDEERQALFDDLVADITGAGMTGETQAAVINALGDGTTAGAVWLSAQQANVNRDAHAVAMTMILQKL